ncbi:MAG: hypothetical protein DRI36_04005 [Caldiserica bacterium]|nr:MAG: hypothetical protein DRI36_04005 [Caldisericota bacterium]
MAKEIKSFEEIKNFLKREIHFLKEKYKVKKIGIFGSYVRGENKKKSDLDILVEFYEPVNLLEIVKLENFLSERLKIKVDIIPETDIRPELRESILLEVIYL